jgi:hypothetical protein
MLLNMHVIDCWSIFNVAAFLNVMGLATSMSYTVLAHRTVSPKYGSDPHIRKPYKYVSYGLVHLETVYDELSQLLPNLGKSQTCS